MAVFELGRVFSDYDVDIHTSQFDGYSWHVEGDVIFTGTSAARVGQGIALREQIRAIANNPDEPVVAVQWSQEGNLNGFYRVVHSDVDIDTVHLTDGTLKWTADLVGLPNRSSSSIESACSWQLVTNNRAVAAPTGGGVPQFAVPIGAWDVGQVSTGSVSGTESGKYTQSTEDGIGVTVYPNATCPANGIYGYSIDPTLFYGGACKITNTFGTATNQMIVGRDNQINTTWNLNNGLTRVSLVSGNLRVEHWSGSAWVRGNSTDWTITVGASTPTWPAMAILRNSPEEVVGRLIGSMSGQRVYLDIALKRGSRWAYCYLARPSTNASWPTAATLAVKAATGTACTAVTGGFRATSNDASGNRFVVTTSAPACTDTLATGQTATTATATSLGFGIGLEFGGSGATTPNSAAVQILEFFSRRSETMRVVSR